jgi:hypothetical protein
MPNQDGNSYCSLSHLGMLVKAGLQAIFPYDNNSPLHKAKFSHKGLLPAGLKAPKICRPQLFLRCTKKKAYLGSERFFVNALAKTSVSGCQVEALGVYRAWPYRSLPKGFCSACPLPKSKSRLNAMAA